MPETRSELPPEIAGLVQALHAAPGKISLVVTGAGTRALGWLFAEPGASRTVLNSRVPYSSSALHEFTGREAEQHVSVSEAQVMAEAALNEAVRLSETPGELLAGVACTAAIMTDRVRRGENRCHVAYSANDGRKAAVSLVMTKGARDRAGEEDIVSRIVLNAVAEAKMVDARMSIPVLNSEQIVRQESGQGPVLA